MSIETLTGDEFAGLTQAEHDEALDLYDVAISKAITGAAPLEQDYDKFADDRDKLGRLLTLRKVHQVRWQELEDARPAAPSAAAQYQQNELHPALVS